MHAIYIQLKCCFFHVQSFEYIHERAYILNSKSLWKAEVTCFREKCLCLLFFLTLQKDADFLPKYQRKFKSF